MGRTELEDAVPTTLGNTFKAFACYIESSIKQITLARESMTFLNMGATAIGTGINCHPDYKNVFEKNYKKLLILISKLLKTLLLQLKILLILYMLVVQSKQLLSA